MQPSAYGVQKASGPPSRGLIPGNAKTASYFINNKLSAITTIPPTNPSKLSWPLP